MKEFSILQTNFPPKMSANCGKMATLTQFPQRILFNSTGSTHFSTNMPFQMTNKQGKIPTKHTSKKVRKSRSLNSASQLDRSCHEQQASISNNQLKTVPAGLSKTL